MARNEQLVRQHRILQILERYRYGRTLEEIRDDLVNELGLSSLHMRSVRRDLEALQSAGLDVDSHETQRGGTVVWKLGSKARGSFKVTASATELIALSLSRDLLYPLAGTPFWQGIETFWTKLREEMPEAIWKHYEAYRQTLYVRGIAAKSYEKQQGMLSTIHRSIVEHRLVEIDYSPAGKDQQTRVIEPYAVVFYHSSLYIIAAAHEIAPGKERMRHLKLDRFTRATALDKWFTPDETFELQKYLGEGLGIFSGGKGMDFKVRISSRAAKWVLEDPWHPAQQVTTHADGSITLVVKAAHDLEIIPRVLALGAEAELLAPASARKVIAGMVAQLAQKYLD